MHNFWRNCHNLLDYVLVYKKKLSSPATFRDAYYLVSQQVFGVDKLLLHLIVSSLSSSCFFLFSFFKFALLIITLVFTEESPTGRIRNGDFFS